MDVVLAPDVFVNASVALGSPPDQVVRRLLGGGEKPKTSRWVLATTEAMLRKAPGFKPEAVQPQMDTIRGLTETVDVRGAEAGDWTGALVALAQAAGVNRVLTDHPDLADQEPVDGVEFLSSEAWLVERAMPPPPPE